MSKDEYGFVKEVDWMGAYVDALREGISKLAPDKQALLKYRYVDKLSYDEIASKYNTVALSNGSTLRDRPEPRDFKNDVHDIDRRTVEHVCIGARDKLADLWASEYEKHNGYADSMYEALHNFDKLFKPEDPDQAFDMSAISDFDVRWAVRSISETLAHWKDKRGYLDDIAGLRDVCDNASAGVSKEDREVVDNYEAWCRDTIHDFAKLQFKWALEPEVMRRMHNSFYDTGFESVGQHLVDYFSDDTISDFGKILADNSHELFDGLGLDESFKPGTAPLTRSLVDGVAVDKAFDIAKSLGYDKQLWSSPEEFIAESLCRYDGESASALRDGTFDALDIGTHFFGDNDFAFVCHSAAKHMFDDMRKDAKRDALEAISDNKDLDIRKALREAPKDLVPDGYAVCAPNGDSSAGHALFYGAMRDYLYLFAADLDQYHVARNDYDFLFVPEVMYGVDFDRLLNIEPDGREPYCDRRITVGYDNVDKYVDETLADIGDKASDLIVNAAVDISLGPDIETACCDMYHYVDTHPEIKDKIVSILKDRENDGKESNKASASPLPKDLENALNNLDDCDDIDEETKDIPGE